MEGGNRERGGLCDLHTRETNRANKANVDNTFVAEAGSSEVDIYLGGQHQVFARSLVGEKAHLKGIEYPHSAVVSVHGK